MAEFTMQQPMVSGVILYYNGVDATSEFSELMDSFTYTDVASGEADTVSIAVNNKNGQWLSSYMPMDGDYIEIQLFVKNWNAQGDDRNISYGKFDIDRFQASGSPSVASIGGITIPIGKDFNVTEKNKTWSQTTVKTMLSDICTNAGIELVYESKDFSVNEKEQSNQSDMNFAYSICKDYNLSMKLYNSKLVVYDQSVYEQKDAVYTIDISQLQKYSYSREKSKLYDSVKLEYVNPKNKEAISYTYVVPGTNGTRMLTLNEEVESYEEAEVKAKSKLFQNIREAVTLSITLKGDISYMSAINVNVIGLGNANGKYFIDRVTHNKSAKGIYTCTLKMHLVLASTDEIEETNLDGSIYTVISGDCLWNIAKKYYGDGTKYMIIYNANKDKIQNPSLIYPGQVLLIPKQ